MPLIIYDIRLFYESTIDELHTLQREISSIKSKGGYYSGMNTSLEREEIADLEAKIDRIKLRTGLDNYKPEYLILTEKILLKEFVADNDEIRNVYINNAFGLFYTYNIMPEKEYFVIEKLRGNVYTKDKLDLVYGAVDVASIALSFFGLDFVAEGAGVYIAAHNKDWKNASIYSAGAVFVLVPAGLVRSAVVNGSHFILDGKIFLIGSDEYVELLISKGLADRAAAQALRNSHIGGLILNNPGKLLEKLNKIDNIAVRGKLLTDLSNDHRLLYRFFDRPELVDSWKVLREANLGDDIAKDIASLSKARRYMDNGLTIEPGGVVKQADGTVIGKLDNNDVYNPGELKVKGEHSGRHFDPDDAGGTIVKKDWNNTTIDQSGIDDITTHLSRFEDFDGDNAFMIDRLQKIKNGEISATDYDKRFYTHELEEYGRYKNRGIADGVNDEGFYYNAHAASLESYSINEINAPLYHPKK